MCRPVEHGVNGAGGFVVFTAPLAAAPVSWRRDGRERIWVEIPGHLDECLGVSPEMLDVAEASQQLLMFERGAGDFYRETWIPMECVSSD